MSAPSDARVKMLSSLVALIAAGIALAWTVLAKGGVYPSDLCFTLIALGAVLILYLPSQSKQLAPPLALWLKGAIVALPVYIALQLIPLPVSLLSVISSTRALLTNALVPVAGQIHFAPISTTPAQTVFGLFTILGYIATFFLVRQLVWRFDARPWIVLLPLLAISTIEASIGVLQSFGGLELGRVTGSYTNHDHYAGSFEMTLPIAAICGVALIRNGRKPGGSPIISTTLACGLWAMTGLFMLAVSYSLSRAGFLISSAALLAVAFVCARICLPSRAVRWIALAGLIFTFSFILVALPSEQLVQRFTTWVPHDNSKFADAELRPKIWHDTLPLIAEFPVFGCGLGGFKSNFMKFQSAAQEFEIEFAHNDYLDYLAELGLIGFAIILVIVFGVVRQTLLGVWRQPDESRRFLQIACSASLICILLHSIVDFNMHIEANAMTLAWIAGAGSISGPNPRTT